MPNESLSSMTMRRIRMKFHAKRALPGNWLRSIFLVFLLALTVALTFGIIVKPIDPAVLQNPPATYEELLKLLLPTPITKNFLLTVGVLGLLYWLVISPLTIGSIRFFTGVARLQKPKLPVAFSIFFDLGQVFRSMGLILWVGILRMFWLVLFTLPYAFVMAMAQVTQSLVLLEVSLLLLLGGLILYYFQFVSYIPAVYLFADNPSLGVFGAVKQSRKITRGHLGECVCMELSFLLWRLFANYAAFIGNAFFLPYYRTTMVVFVDSLRVRFDPSLIVPQPEEEVTNE